MAERGSDTHGPALDDKMKQETQGLVKGNQPTHAEDWRETETVDDDISDLPDPATEGDGARPESGSGIGSADDVLADSGEAARENADGTGEAR